MSYAIKQCVKCGREFVTGGLGIAVQKTCDMCSEGGKWEKHEERRVSGGKHD